MVGAGPGDPGLLTLKGKRCLEQADVIIYDYLVECASAGLMSGPKLLCSTPENGEGAEPFRSRPFMPSCVSTPQTVKSSPGSRVGDPLLFGRGGEEAEELVAANIPF